MSTYSNTDTSMNPSCVAIAYKPKFSCVQFKNLLWCFLLVFHRLQSETGLFGVYNSQSFVRKYCSFRRGWHSNISCSPIFVLSQGSQTRKNKLTSSVYTLDSFASSFYHILVYLRLRRCSKKYRSATNCKFLAWPSKFDDPGRRSEFRSLLWCHPCYTVHSGSIKLTFWGGVALLCLRPTPPLPTSICHH